METGLIDRIRSGWMLIVMCAIPWLISCKEPLPFDKWQYVLIDSTRSGNDLVKNWGTFGMDVLDGNKDGYGDLAVGKNFYLNPGDRLNEGWVGTIVQDTMDIIFMVDVDGDEFSDLIGLRCNEQFWLESENEQHTIWKKIKIGNEAICNHQLSSMGFAKGDLYPGGKQELLFTDKPGKIWCFEIPDEPDQNWPVSVLSENGGTEKFISLGDIDQDGDLDIATGYKPVDSKVFNGVCWFENPGLKIGAWLRHEIGMVNYTADHFAIADFDEDGIMEILVTEGRAPEEYPAGIYLFMAPSGDVFDTNWHQNLIVTQYSTNSLEVADMDLDGDLDFVAGEHKGSLKLQIWENDGHANFVEHLIDSLKESHNGTNLFDIEGDGDLDILSSGWYDKSVHLWINQAIDHTEINN